MLCVLACVIIFVFHVEPYSSVFLEGYSPAVQLAFAASLGTMYFAVASFGHRRLLSRNSAKHVVESYSRLDLAGLNPLWIAVAAGLGEELLFRGALQPVLGIWVTSAIFVAAHARAYRFDGLDPRVIGQVAALFAISSFFGVVAKQVGLLAAIGSHTVVDIVGLYYVRRASVLRGAA